jgi:hypothetical protein
MNSSTAARVYRQWLECNEDVTVSSMQRINFMVFEMMKDYYRYVCMAPIYMNILRRGVEVLNIPSNRNPNRLVYVQLWMHRIETILDMYVQEEEYVLHFITQYNLNHKIAQDPPAQELFVRFDGGRYFSKLRVAFKETNFHLFLPQIGGRNIPSHVFENEDNCG